MKFKSLLASMGLILSFSLHAEQINVLKRSNATEPSTMDIHSVNDAATFSILRDLYETLVLFSPDGTLKPGAAEKWDVSSDKKTYSFTLRKNAKWSNGDPLTAHDFVYSWRHLVDPKTASPYANHCYVIHNAEEIVKGTKKPEELGVKAIDDYHFEVTLRAPAHHFLSLLVHPPFSPLHQKSLDADPKNYTRAGKLVSNGAFMLEDWVINSVLKVKKNPHYWGATSVKLDGVHYFPIDGETEFTKYRAGELDMAVAVPDDKLDFIEKSDFAKEMIKSPFFGMLYMGINSAKAPFDNPKLREALSLVVDREKIVKSVLHGGEEALYGWNYPYAPNYKKTCLAFKDMPMDKRIERAKQLYKEAGYSAENPLKFEVRSVDVSSRKKILNAIASMWKETLGAKVEIINTEFKIYIQELKQKNFNVYLGRFVGLYNDPHTFAELMVKDSGMNMVGYNNPKYDELIAKAVAETDLEKRADYYAASERILLDDHPVIPLTTVAYPKLVKPYVKGFKPSVMDVFYAKDLWLEK